MEGMDADRSGGGYNLRGTFYALSLTLGSKKSGAVAASEWTKVERGRLHGQVGRASIPVLLSPRPSSATLRAEAAVQQKQEVMPMQPLHRFCNFGTGGAAMAFLSDGNWSSHGGGRREGGRFPEQKKDKNHATRDQITLFCAPYNLLG